MGGVSTLARSRYSMWPTYFGIVVPSFPTIRQRRCTQLNMPPLNKRQTSFFISVGGTPAAKSPLGNNFPHEKIPRAQERKRLGQRCNANDLDSLHQRPYFPIPRALPRQHAVLTSYVLPLCLNNAALWFSQ